MHCCAHLSSAIWIKGLFLIVFFSLIASYSRDESWMFSSSLGNMTSLATHRLLLLSPEGQISSSLGERDNILTILWILLFHITTLVPYFFTMKERREKFFFFKAVLSLRRLPYCLTHSSIDKHVDCRNAWWSAFSLLLFIFLWCLCCWRCCLSLWWLGRAPGWSLNSPGNALGSFQRCLFWSVANIMSYASHGTHTLWVYVPHGCFLELSHRRLVCVLVALPNPNSAGYRYSERLCHSSLSLQCGVTVQFLVAGLLATTRVQRHRSCSYSTEERRVTARDGIECPQGIWDIKGLVLLDSGNKNTVDSSCPHSMGLKMFHRCWNYW